jgi:hypothetical protein
MAKRIDLTITLNGGAGPFTITAKESVLDTSNWAHICNAMGTGGFYDAIGQVYYPAHRIDSIAYIEVPL